MAFLTDADIMLCKHVGIRNDKNGYSEYYCKLCDFSCEDVLRCSDGCQYEKIDLSRKDLFWNEDDYEHFDV